VVAFEHPAVEKTWLTYRVTREAEGEEEAEFLVETVLHLALTRAGPPPDELIDALTDFLLEHDDIDSAELVPPGSPVSQ
jgi:hypothetical protein